MTCRSTTQPNLGSQCTPRPQEVHVILLGPVFSSILGFALPTAGYAKTGRTSVIRSAQARYANSPPAPELAETSPHYREDVTETLQPLGPNLSLATPSSPRRLEEKAARLPGGEGDRPRDPHSSPRNAAEGAITRDYATRPDGTGGAPETAAAGETKTRDAAALIRMRRGRRVGRPGQDSSTTTWSASRQRP